MALPTGPYYPQSLQPLGINFRNETYWDSLGSHRKGDKQAGVYQLNIQKLGQTW